VTVPLADGLAFFHGDPSIAHSARLLRTALVSASYIGDAGDGTLRSGLLPGPDGADGTVDVLTSTSARVRKFHAVVQGTHSLTQGGYVCSLIADATLDLPDRDASLYRRSLLAVRVLDSQAAGVAADGSNNAGELALLTGPLAASAAASALPDPGANALNLGYFTSPPVGVGSVTFTPYEHRAAHRGGILVVAATGDVDLGPAHRGHYRDHPTRGLQRGLADGGAWETVSPRTRHLGSDTGADGTATVDAAIVNLTVTVPADLPSTARLRYTGDAFVVCPAGVHPKLSFHGGRGAREIDRGTITSDLHIEYYDSDLTPGNRNVQLRADAVGGEMDYYAPRLHVSIV